MALGTAHLTQASATLSGGAATAASGGGLPARITTAGVVLSAEMSDAALSVIWEPGGTHILVADRSSTIKRVNAASCSTRPRRTRSSTRWKSPTTGPSEEPPCS